MQTLPLVPQAELPMVNRPIDVEHEESSPRSSESSPHVLGILSGSLVPPGGATASDEGTSGLGLPTADETGTKAVSLRGIAQPKHHHVVALGGLSDRVHRLRIVKIAEHQDHARPASTSHQLADRLAETGDLVVSTPSKRFDASPEVRTQETGLDPGPSFPTPDHRTRAELARLLLSTSQYPD